MVSEKFFDDFLGSSVDTSAWTAFNSPVVASSELYLQMGLNGYVTSVGKKIFPVNTDLQVEFYVRDDGGSWDMQVSLFDTSNSANYIVCGQTNYSSSGVYSAGAGIFVLSQVGVGNMTNVKKYYRLEISGTAMNTYFGDNPGNATLVQTRTLPTSIAGKTFYLQLGGGGNPYGGAYWDSVRVLTDVVSGSINIPVIPNVPSVPSIVT